MHGRGLRDFVAHLYAARRNKDGSITIRTTDARTLIALQDDLPEEAYKQLAQMTLDELDGGNWIWDSERNRWIDQNEWMRRQ